MERKHFKLDSVVFYDSFYKSIRELPAENQVNLYNAIFEYAFNGEEPELSGVEKAIFLLIKPQLDANRTRYENGCKGGRPKKETETEADKNLNETKIKPNYNLSETKPEPNYNYNVNVNENYNENENETDKNNSHDFLNNSPQKVKSALFKPPTFEEVQAYCIERNNRVNAQQFIDFYQSNGWMVGKNKMKDWRAAIRTWEARDKKGNQISEEIEYAN